MNESSMNQNVKILFEKHNNFDPFRMIAASDKLSTFACAAGYSAAPAPSAGEESPDNVEHHTT